MSAALTEWRCWTYPFPVDDEAQALFDVFETLDGKFARSLDWTLSDRLIVVVPDWKTAVLLRIAFDNQSLTSVSGASILETNEVLIGLDQRAECEALLCVVFRSKARWFSVVSIHAQTDEAWRAFDHSYRRVMPHTPLKAISR